MPRRQRSPSAPRCIAGAGDGRGPDPRCGRQAAQGVAQRGGEPARWLRRRRGPDGRPMLDEASFVAGERFRADLTRGLMLPRVTSDWSGSRRRPRRARAGGGERRGAGGPPADRARLARHGRRSGGAARRCLRLPEGAGGRRAGAPLAGAIRQGRAAAGAGRGWRSTTATGARRGGRTGRAASGPGASIRRSRRAGGVRVRSGSRSSGGASAARACALMRSTMERTPFERCGVRCSDRPSSAKSAGVVGLEDRRAAGLPEKSASVRATSPRTIWASLSPRKSTTGSPSAWRRAGSSSQTWLAQPRTLFSSVSPASGSGSSVLPSSMR